MSIFKKLVKGHGNQNTNNSNPSQHTNEEKTNSGRLQDQIKILNSYIQEMAKENEMLQSKNNDMKTTLYQNKQLLDDYISNIGQNDQLVSKLKLEIDFLRAQQTEKDELYRPTNGGMTTKATTIYQTSPKNSAMTQYTFENNLKSPKSNSHSVVSLVCPQCKCYFKYNMPHNKQANQSQDILLKKQKELIDEINNLKFEMNAILNEQQKSQNQFMAEQSDDEQLSSQRSLQSYSRPSKVHTFSQMFVDQNNKDLKHVQEILDESTKLNELILFQDSKGEIWSIMKRSDLLPKDLIQDEGQENGSYREEKDYQHQMTNESGEDEHGHEEYYDEDEEDEEDDDEEQVNSSEQNEEITYQKGKRQQAIMQLQSQISQQNQNQKSLVNKNVGGASSKKTANKNANGEDKNVIVSVLNTEEQEC